MALPKYYTRLVRKLNQETQRVGGFKYDSRQSKSLSQHLQKAQLFYILGDSKKALAECRKFNKRIFSGDHRIWGNISSFLYLDAHISRNEGKTQEWIDRMRIILAVSGNNLKWFETLLPNRRASVESHQDNPNLQRKIIACLTLFRLLVETIELRKFLRMKGIGLQKELTSTMRDIRALADKLATDSNLHRRFH